MKIVIDIPEHIYRLCQGHGDPVYRYIANGTPLPKGHGRLIDKDRLLDELEKTVKSVDDTNKHLLFWDRAVAHVHLSKTIIEADNAESDGKA